MVLGYIRPILTLLPSHNKNGRWEARMGSRWYDRGHQRESAQFGQRTRSTTNVCACLSNNYISYIVRVFPSDLFFFPSWNQRKSKLNSPPTLYEQVPWFPLKEGGMYNTIQRSWLRRRSAVHCIAAPSIGVGDPPLLFSICCQCAAR